MENCFHFVYFLSVVEKYDYVGRLLKPGEQPREYSDDEEQTDENTNKTDEDKKNE